MIMSTWPPTPPTPESLDPQSSSHESGHGVDAIEYYVGLYNRNRDVLRASFGFYRAWDATVTQNMERKKTKLTIPVLGIGGEAAGGALAAEGMKPAANDVQTAVIPGAGHWLAEQAPEQMLAVLTRFLAPTGLLPRTADDAVPSAP
jgi:pimeloyl-ACP methyl ester carboxylesterase